MPRTHEVAIAGAGPRSMPREPLDHSQILGLVNGEAAVLRPADCTVFIYQKAVRHHAELELNAG